MKRYFTIPLAIIVFLVTGFHSNPDQTKPRPVAAYAPVYINEFVSLNFSGIQDEHGDRDDWIELYNGGDEAVHLGEWYITDNISDPDKWQIPSWNPDAVTIQPQGFLILWADGEPGEGPCHLGFQLSGDGEDIALFDSDGATLIDSKTYTAQVNDISHGRQPDGAKTWNFFTEPTPGQSNTTPGMLAQAAEPVFSPPGGFFTFHPEIQLSSDTPDAVIRFTRDGSEPTSESVQYTDPILIVSTTVLRARVFLDGYLPSETATHTYFIDEPLTLPVMSLVTDPKNLWGATGIYDNKEAGMEKPIHVEYFEIDNDLGFALDGGIKIHSPDNKPQQSFRLYARSQYGQEAISYPLFPDKDIDSFSCLILRNAGNDGLQGGGLAPGEGAHMRDGLASLLYNRINSSGSYSAVLPVHVFLNGLYWGIYNLRERQDKDYILNNFGTDNIDFLERTFNHPGNKNAIEGDWQQYEFLENYADTAELNDPDHYQFIQTLMDVENFTDYWILEVYAGNVDWLKNNTKFWRSRDPAGPFRWILWDVDHGFGLPFTYENVDYGESEWNTMAWSISLDGFRMEGGIYNALMRNLLENALFRQDFITRFADLMNSVLLPARIDALIDSLQSLLSPDIGRQADRWGSSVENWETALDVMRSYASERPGHMRNHLLDCFDMTGTFSITLHIEPPGSGSILINTLSPDLFPWEGVYFSGIPITLTAEPASNFTFSEWMGITGSSTTVQMTSLEDLSITAVFESLEIDTILVLFNEINYNSAEAMNTGDWVEIYNPHNVPIDLSYWTFRDENDGHIFSLGAGTRIESRDFLILCRDWQAFQSFFPECSHVLGDFPFGLGNDGDAVRLFDAEEQLVDMVLYDDAPPWPTVPDGSGYTLEYLPNSLDNNLPENWSASSVKGGTPGQPNQTTGIKPTGQFPRCYQLYQNYPNPFNQTTFLKYDLPVTADVRIDIFNLRGQRITTLVHGLQEAGSGIVAWNGTGPHSKTVESGLYLVRMEADGFVLTRKILFIK